MRFTRRWCYLAPARAMLGAQTYFLQRDHLIPESVVYPQRNSSGGPRNICLWSLVVYLMRAGEANRDVP